MRPHSCIDCGMKVPPQDDESALISMKYGWRLTRRVGPDGKAVLEWRCPRCWAVYRDKRAGLDKADKPREDGT